MTHDGMDSQWTTASGLARVSPEHMDELDSLDVVQHALHGAAVAQIEPDDARRLRPAEACAHGSPPVNVERALDLAAEEAACWSL